jgi:hypothetical protein
VGKTGGRMRNSARYVMGLALDEEQKIPSAVNKNHALKNLMQKIIHRDDSSGDKNDKHEYHKTM